MNALRPTAVGLLLLCTLPAWTQTSVDEAAPIAVSVPEPAKTPLDISGYVDLYYRYADHEVGSVTSFTETSDAFSLGMVNLLFSKQTGHFGFVADLGFGPRAIAANGNAGSILAAVKQLYISYALTTRLQLTAGNFATFVGYESIDATANPIYSTSYLFSKGPFYHTGLKVDYAFTKKWSGMVGIFNDTDSKFDDVKGNGFTLIPEVRLDSATGPTFHDGKDGLTKTVASALIAAVYKF